MLRLPLTKSGSYLDLGSFSDQLSRADNTNPLDLAVVKKIEQGLHLARFGGKCRKRDCTNGSNTKKPIALSAVSINLDQRALERVSGGYSNDRPMHIIYDGTSGKIVSSRNVILIEKSDSPSSMVDNAGEESKSSDDLGNVNKRVTNLESAGLGNVEGDNNLVH